MGGVDLCDRMISFYRMKTRTNKWTIRAIFHLIDLAVVNSWILYKQDQIRKEVPVKKYINYQILKFNYQVNYWNIMKIVLIIKNILKDINHYRQKRKDIKVNKNYSKYQVCLR